MHSMHIWLNQFRNWCRHSVKVTQL